MHKEALITLKPQRLPHSLSHAHTHTHTHACDVRERHFSFLILHPNPLLPSHFRSSHSEIKWGFPKCYKVRIFLSFFSFSSFFVSKFGFLSKGFEGFLVVMESTESSYVSSPEGPRKPPITQPNSLPSGI